MNDIILHINTHFIFCSLITCNLYSIYSSKMAYYKSFLPTVDFNQQPRHNKKNTDFYKSVFFYFNNLFSKNLI